MRRGVRGIAFVVVGLAHVVLIALLMTATKQRPLDPDEAPRMTLVFLDSAAMRQPEAANEPTQLATPSLRQSPPPSVNIELPRIDASSAITVPPDAPPIEGTTPPSIDWQQETRTAAARMAESLDAERRRKAERTPDPRFARPTPRPEFGWDRSKTHQVEALPQGGTVIHLNDRCALVLSGFLLPVCKIGKIPARGDLFEHMGDSHDPDE